MNGRAIVRILASLVVVALLIGLGVSIYDAGIQQGIVDAGRVPTGAAVPYAGGYGYPHGFFGFGFLGFLFPLFFLFLFFGILRAAFWGGRGRGGWGHGGHGWDRESWQSERERHIADLHQHLHETGNTGSGGSSGGGSSSGGSSGSTGSAGPA
jgi:hypothetical protein